MVAWFLFINIRHVINLDLIDRETMWCFLVVDRRMSIKSNFINTYSKYEESTVQENKLKAEQDIDENTQNFKTKLHGKKATNGLHYNTLVMFQLCINDYIDTA